MAIKLKKFIEKTGLIHKSFETTLAVKAFDGVIQTLSGVAMLFASPKRLSYINQRYFSPEIIDDPQDRLAGFVIKLISNYTTSTQFWALFYLLSHGIVNLILAYLLWKKKLTAYPIAMIVLVGYIGYQMYRFANRPSMFLIILSIWDLITIWLTWLEYLKLKGNHDYQH